MEKSISVYFHFRIFFLHLSMSIYCKTFEFLSHWFKINVQRILSIGERQATTINWNLCHCMSSMFFFPLSRFVFFPLREQWRWREKERKWMRREREREWDFVSKKTIYALHLHIHRYLVLSVIANYSRNWTKSHSKNRLCYKFEM